VGLYIHENLKYVLRQNLHLVIDNCENLWIEIHTSKTQKNIILGIIYRHLHSNLSNLNDVMSNRLSELLNGNKQLVILGDINIDLVKCESNQLLQII
jgi:hypothetical protein